MYMIKWTTRRNCTLDYIICRSECFDMGEVPENLETAALLCNSTQLYPETNNKRMENKQQAALRHAFRQEGIFFLDLCAQI